MIALTPFRKENGATEIAPGLVDKSKTPSEEEFEKEKIVADNLDGDSLSFDTHRWYRGDHYKSNLWRHTVALNICKAYMRQQFDYPAILSQSIPQSSLPRDFQRFLGYHVRMPKNSTHIDPVKNDFDELG